MSNDSIFGEQGGAAEEAAPSCNNGLNLDQKCYAVPRAQDTIRDWKWDYFEIGGGGGKSPATKVSVFGVKIYGGVKGKLNWADKRRVLPHQPSKKPFKLLTPNTSTWGFRSCFFFLASLRLSISFACISSRQEFELNTRESPACKKLLHIRFRTRLIPAVGGK